MLQGLPLLRTLTHRLEAEMRTMEQLEPTLRHYFAAGVYARELSIPRGATVVGKIHKYPQINIMSQGDLSVLVDDRIVRVKAPFTIVSPAGTKRVAYAHEDTVWTTLHGTDETDLALIEERFIAQSEDEWLAFAEERMLEEAVKCLG